MNENIFQREFYLKLDKECQQIVDSWYKIISELSYYENSCGFELPEHLKKLKQTIITLLKNYEEIQL